jgi:LysM repeat protein
LQLFTYVVQTGDSLYSIATRFGVPVETILQDSGITDPNSLFVGQTIYIPRQVPSSPFPPFPGAVLEQRVSRLEREVNRLNQRVNRLDNENDRLRERINRLDQRVDRLERER